jgi:hypothetical protein
MPAASGSKGRADETATMAATLIVRECRSSASALSGNATLPFRYLSLGDGQDDGEAGFDGGNDSRDHLGGRLPVQLVKVYYDPSLVQAAGWNNPWSSKTASMPNCDDSGYR